MFGSLKNMIEHAINSSKCFVFGFLQNTIFHAINSCLLLPKHDQTRNDFLQILCVCSSPNYPRKQFIGFFYNVKIIIIIINRKESHENKILIKL
jgi:hypothetical protein